MIARFAAGDHDGAAAAYARVLPASNYENRQCGFRSAKAAKKAGGVFASDFRRHPIRLLHPDTRAEMIRIIRPLGPFVVNWGK